MFGKKKKDQQGLHETPSPPGDPNQSNGPARYSLDWPTSQRWNPRYMVPRNSVESTDPFSSQARLETGIETPRRHPTAYLRSKRDVDTSADLVGLRNRTGSSGVTGKFPGVKDPIKNGNEAGDDIDDDDDDHEEFSNLAHWLETLAELYMNELDNRARWDPRWLNITRRERYEGLSSATVTVVDYIDEASPTSPPHAQHIANKRQLAATLQSRPAGCPLRVVLVSDLSRFVMGVLGQLYAVEPEFWLDHLANSGYAASDSGLKLKNAVWLNWAQRETQFRHHPLPGPGQRTEWNSPRRLRGRTWSHFRWARLGVLNYLGRKGFHQDEIERRLVDGRWLVERDVVLDKYGMLMTQKRQAQLDKTMRKREKKSRKRGGIAREVTQPPAETFMRCKTTNVYRAYSTFDGLPKNPYYWRNRDLRVMAPEGASFWSGVDEDGKKIAIVLFDPTRSMKSDLTQELTPSLTFMPRPMEIESYTEEELWRTPDLDETYLDPPPPLPSPAEIKKQKKEAMKLKLKDRRERLRGRLERGLTRGKGHVGGPPGNMEAQAEVTETDGFKQDDEYDTVSSYSSDSDYDEEYERDLRNEYVNPQPHIRARDFARKYALTTHDLFHRYMSPVPAANDGDDDTSGALLSILVQLSLDDLWQLVSELRLDLDQLDADFGADLHLKLLESIGNTTRQNLNWMRTSLREVSQWVDHISTSWSSSQQQHPDPSNENSSSSSSTLTQELHLLASEIVLLQSRTEQTLTLLATSMSIAQSTQVIDQTSGINKLTELAFFFVPISFITAIFSMQVRELTAIPPPIWSWGVALSSIVVATYLVRVTLRSPSLRVLALHCRATIINRFSPSGASSASRRTNTIGNRAIAKFALFAFLVLLYATGFIIVYSVAYFFIFIGIWLAAAGTAIYFIATRWPDPAVLVPCFISLPLAGLGMWVAHYWSDEIEALSVRFLDWGSDKIKRSFPPHWTLDAVDDDDLAKEGVNTYTRQAIVLAT